MKLTKKQEAKLLKTYKSYWDGYLSGDVKNMAKLLDDNYTQVGSAEAEVFSNKKDAVKFLHDTIDQVVGQVEIRNRSITLEYLDDYILVNDLFNIYVLTDGEWVYYAKLRAFTLMAEDKGKWKFIHQHSSVPDIRTEDGENIATDKIAAENIQLRDAIKRRTVELESKNRELEIEAALERVRARTMAMQKTADLLKVGEVLYKEIAKLGVVNLTSGYVLMEEDEKIGWNYNSDPADGTILDEPVGVPHTETAVMRAITKSWKNKEPYHLIELDPQKTIAHQTFVAERSINFPHTAEELISFSPERLILQTFNFKEGYLLLVGGEKLNDSHVEMMIRFTKVFEQTYTRFLDLQKAEGQARESEIELALERVRARTMAMQHSDDLREVVRVIYEQLDSLNFEVNSCNLIIMDKQSDDMQYWVSGNIQKIYPESYHVSNLNHPYLKALLDAWKRDDDYAVFEYSGKEKIGFDKLFFTQTGFKKIPDQTIQRIKSLKMVTLSTAFFNYGALQVIRPKPITAEHAKTLQRMAKVFEQTYTRFLDLQKAEEQVREAKINLAVERVRAKALAMHKSVEIMEVVAKLKDEVMALGISGVIAATIFLKEGEDKVRMWDLSSLEITDGVYQVPTDIIFKFKKTDPHLYSKRVWENQANYFVEIQDKKGFKRLLAFIREQDGKDEAAKEFEEFIETTQLKRLYHAAKKLNNGKLVIDLLNPPADEMEGILTKMGAAFDLAYKRFEDLQKAESQAREAQIEAALERVRSKSMAMHKSEDIGETVATLFDELLKVGIHKSSRSGIGILNETKNMKLWSARFNSADEVDLLIGNLDMTINPFLKKIKNAWKKQEEQFYYELEGKELLDYYASLNQEYDYALRTDMNKLPEKEFVHVFTFKLGIIYSFNSVPISAEAKQVFIRFAKVFEQTYTRFLDLQKAESQAIRAEKDLVEIKIARKKAEEALTELQSTQSQLIQSEKMASLGELTAGIAHEIQNPLNFVNNFSEVSTELIDEMNEEIEKGNMEDVKEISSDLKQNLEKINHHGKRAGDIVKGMLQHSRTSSGVKETTDINALADEYLRLAYHGLRAKNKSFNAIMNTDFDETIGTINIIPQDIGRVILNLITNAFYAVDEKKKSTSAKASEDSYEPGVSVLTKKEGDKVLISVKDNGNGIPEQVLDKIFQPFFTTKPTGQGTGLGLSLSYDIVKAHGGELKVETKEGKGSEFNILLHF